MVPRSVNVAPLKALGVSFQIGRLITELHGRAKALNVAKIVFKWKNVGHSHFIAP